MITKANTIERVRSKESSMVIASAVATDRADFVAGRAAATCAVAMFLGVDPSRVVIRSAADGSPVAWRTDATGDAHAVSVSISHTDGRAIAAAADWDTLVGIDVAREATVARDEARFFTTLREREAVTEPTLLWVLKEAAWKALSCGDRLAFKELELLFDPRGELREAAVRGRRVPATARVLRPWPGHIAAVVRCPRYAR